MYAFKESINKNICDLHTVITTITKAQFIKADDKLDVLKVKNDLFRENDEKNGKTIQSQNVKHTN